MGNCITNHNGQIAKPTKFSKFQRQPVVVAKPEAIP